MSINFSTKSVKFPGALKAYTETQLEAISKIAGDIIDADVIVNEEKINFRVEISLKTRLDSFYGKGESRILKQAVRSAIAAVKTQAKKIKEKIKMEKKRGGEKPLSFDLLEGGSPKRSRERRLDEREAILVSDNFSRKPISVEEAIFFLKESKENCYMFVNADTSRSATVFWNRQGSISLIEPEL